MLAKMVKRSGTEQALRVFPLLIFLYFNHSRLFYFFLNHFLTLLSILSNAYIQIESRIKIANENLSNEKIFAFVASTPENSSNAIDKAAEIKYFKKLQ